MSETKDWITWLEEANSWRDDVKVLGGGFAQRFAKLPWEPNKADQEAAHALYIELLTRLPVCPLHWRDGDDESAAASLHALFRTIRELSVSAEMDPRHFQILSIAMLNGYLRPFLAAWHGRMESGILIREDGARLFHRELAVLTRQMEIFARLFGRMAGHDDQQLSVELPERVEAGHSFNAKQIWPIAFLGPQRVPDESEELAGIFQAEIAQVRKRRESLYGMDDEKRLGGLGPAEDRPSESMGFFGLALSGGGIRSATFALGALQELADRKILRDVDYLSTVSGGGYAGSFLTSRLLPGAGAPDDRNTPTAFSELRDILIRDPDVVVETDHVRWLRNRSKAMLGAGMLRTAAQLLGHLVWHFKWALLSAILAGAASYCTFPCHDVAALVLALACVIVVFSFNPNTLSLRRVYRQRLAEIYIRRNRASKIPKVSELTEAATSPYHLICAAVNLPSSKNVELRGRRSDFFVFSPLYSGSILTGYRKSTDLEACDPDLDFATAIAVSGAALSTHMGTLRHRLIVRPFLALLRLSYWLPNPRWSKPSQEKKTWHGPGLAYLVRELAGRFDEQGKYVNVSDGGHIENLGIYELLRRRCKFILCVDGEQDPAQRCAGLIKAIRFASIDMGITIEIDLSQLHADEQGNARTHFAMGTINYNRNDAGNLQVGYLLYLKLSMTGNECDYIHEYRSRKRTFPHETTADQFFDEDQFEAYRALGRHAAGDLFSERLIGNMDAQQYRARVWLERLVAATAPPAPRSSAT